MNSCHEYILCFAKNIDELKMLWAPMSKACMSPYKKEDKNGKYREQHFAWQNSSTNPNQIYPIQTPEYFNIIPKQGYIYRFIRASFEKLNDERRITFKKTPHSVYTKEDGSSTEWSISVKDYLGNAQTAPATMLPNEYVKTNIEAVNELKSIFDNKLFEYTKPSSLIKYLSDIFTNDNDFVMDFFAGSGTTADAVMRLNAEDGGNRKFILVQWDEEIDSEKSKIAYDFCTENNLAPFISSICIERVNRAGKKIKTEQTQKTQDIFAEKTNKLDIGYKVFSLSKRPKLASGDDNQLSFEVNRTTAEDTLYNMAAASGKTFTHKVEEIEKDVLYKIDDSYFLLGECKTDLASKTDLAIYIDGYANISLEKWLNVVGLDKENITILY